MPIRVLCVGAHPDDCEGSVGGTAILCRRRGDAVRFVSVTEGSRGHFEERYREHPVMLIERRMKEARRATEPFGIEFECMGVPDGEVYVTQALTEAMIRLIRRFKPDLVLMNRPCDYHRDHRYSAQLVLDATYMLTVPLLCADTPSLRTEPVFAYWQDGFTEAGAFRADVTVRIDEALDAKRDMMLAHESQYLEWLPYNASAESRLYGLPDDPAERGEAVRRVLVRSNTESFQISEYGRAPTASEMAELFP